MCSWWVYMRTFNMSTACALSVKSLPFSFLFRDTVVAQSSDSATRSLFTFLFPTPTNQYILRPRISPESFLSRLGVSYSIFYQPVLPRTTLLLSTRNSHYFVPPNSSSHLSRPFPTKMSHKRKERKTPGYSWGWKALEMCADHDYSSYKGELCPKTFFFFLLKL
jgi:hypothetical protein